ncbi:nucleotide sugar dehydrogenase [Sphingomonas abietis]|uniref:Nucleotide sugar dehydrogenase n=1 Tax=Sphingomonas abietis TaxID=3012344 RepID=A0ABY7NJ43_9SPHN|nr:nucleotide sugar dehydrogenase [Sphingomonas abietis]WBO20835.1 nucleotide sugar dehydrogenase [Sphingomonas abietis]
MDQPHIVVVGLGYVGLPLAVALARHFPTVGIDIDATRIAELERHHDRTNEIDAGRLAATSLTLTSDPGAVPPADIYIVTVPTPVDAANRPDLSIVESASRMVGRMMAAERRPIICFESTVYPGVTEDVCGPILEQVSGLRRGADFFLGYSPERINPGDREHTIDRITKVVAGENAEVTDRLAAIYGAVTTGGTHKAESIKVAEAAKVIENAQRDINIAFMNEITRIFSLMDISVWEVLRAAGTKWNFLPFQPGLVGGHCIGVDPYYLAHAAATLGHDPAVILSGRAINDGMGAWVADQLSERLAPASDVLVMGLTFKEDVPDLRNSKVVDVIARLKALGHRVDVSDPRANPAEAQHEYGLALVANPGMGAYDSVLVAVPHAQYRADGAAGMARHLKPGGVLADLKGLFAGQTMPDGVTYWGL